MRPPLAQQFGVARVVQLRLAGGQIVARPLSRHHVAPATGEVFPCLVDGDVAALGVEDGQRQRHDIQQQFGEGQLGLQLTLCLDALGDVHRAAGVAHDAPIGQQGRHGDIEFPHGRVRAQQQMRAAGAGRPVGGEQGCCRSCRIRAHQRRQ
jgi:hypothetical protein